MVKRNIPRGQQEPTYDCCPPCPPCPPTPPLPEPIAIGVNSINGLQGDVLLKHLIVGEKLYNGSSDIEITAEDLGLLKALRYEGARTKEQIDEMKGVPVGYLYFCVDDLLYYLSTGEGDWRRLLSGKSLDREILERKSGDEQLQVEIDGIKISVDEILAAIDLHEGRITNLETHSKYVDEELKNIYLKLNTHDKDISELKVTVQDIIQEQKVIDDKVINLSKIVDVHDEKIINNTADIKTLFKRADAAEERLNDDDVLLSRHSESIDRLDKVVDATVDDVSELKVNVKNLAQRQVVTDKKIEDIQNDISSIKPIVAEVPKIKKIAEEAKAEASRAVETSEEALVQAKYAKEKVDGLAIRVSNLEYRQVVTDQRLEKLEKDTIQKITAVDKELTADENNNVTLSKSNKSTYGLVKLGNEFTEDEVLTINEVSTDKIIQGNKSILLQAVDE